MEGVLLETAKGLDTTGSLCLCKIEEDKKSFKAGLRCRSKRQPGDLPTTDWLESRVNESVPATGEPRTMKAARSTGDQTGQSTATRIMQTSLHSPAAQVPRR